MSNIDFEGRFNPPMKATDFEGRFDPREPVSAFGNALEHFGRLVFGPSALQNLKMKLEMKASAARVKGSIQRTRTEELDGLEYNVPDGPRIETGPASPMDYLGVAAEVPGRAVSEVWKSVVRGVSAPGQALRGELQVMGPEQKSGGHATPEAIGAALDIAGGQLATSMFPGRYPVGSLGVFGAHLDPKSKVYKRLAKDVANAKAKGTMTGLETKATPTVLVETGLSKDYYGNWVLEIDDSVASLRSEIDSTPRPISEVLDHPDLFEAFPYLRDYKIRRSDGTYAGEFDFDNKTISLGAGKGEGDLSTILHEVQHAVQIEEAATGARKATGEMADTAWLENSVAKLGRVYSRIKEKGLIPEDKQLIFEDLLSELKTYYDYYKSNPGEVEARNVQGRMALTAAERRQLPPELTEDIPRGAQLDLTEFRKIHRKGVKAGMFEPIPMMNLAERHGILSEGAPTPQSAGPWRKPPPESLRQEYAVEYQRHFRPAYGDAFPTEAAFIEAVEAAPVVRVTPEMDAQIGNRSHTKSFDELHGLISGYRSYPEYRNVDTLTALDARIRAGEPTDMPIVTVMPDGRMRVLSGNTRMDLAAQAGKPVDVIMLQVPEAPRVSGTQIVEGGKPAIEFSDTASARRGFDELYSATNPEQAVLMALAGDMLKENVDVPFFVFDAEKGKLVGSYMDENVALEAISNPEIAGFMHSADDAIRMTREEFQLNDADWNSMSPSSRKEAVEAWVMGKKTFVSTDVINQKIAEAIDNNAPSFTSESAVLLWAYEKGHITKDELIKVGTENVPDELGSITDPMNYAKLQEIVSSVEQPGKITPELEAQVAGLEKVIDEGLASFGEYMPEDLASRAMTAFEQGIISEAQHAVIKDYLKKLNVEGPSVPEWAGSGAAKGKKQTLHVGNPTYKGQTLVEYKDKNGNLISYYYDAMGEPAFAYLNNDKGIVDKLHPHQINFPPSPLASKQGTPTGAPINSWTIGNLTAHAYKSIENDGSITVFYYYDGKLVKAEYSGKGVPPTELDIASVKAPGIGESIPSPYANLLKDATFHYAGTSMDEYIPKGGGQLYFHYVDDGATPSFAEYYPPDGSGKITLDPTQIKFPEKQLHPDIIEWREYFTEDWMKVHEKLEAQERSVLSNYSGSYAQRLNSALGKYPDELAEHLSNIEAFDSIFTKAALPQDMTLYRGISERHWDRTFQAAEVGDIIDHPAYASTSVKQNAATNFGSYLLVIKAPKGTKGIAMGDLSPHRGEKEIVLPRGIQFRIVSKEGGTVTVEPLPYDKPPPLPEVKPVPESERHIPTKHVKKAEALFTKIDEYIISDADPGKPKLTDPQSQKLAWAKAEDYISHEDYNFGTKYLQKVEETKGVTPTEKSSSKPSKIEYDPAELLENIDEILALTDDESAPSLTASYKDKIKWAYSTGHITGVESAKLTEYLIVEALN